MNLPSVEELTDPQRKRPALLCQCCLKEPRTIETWGGVWLGAECGALWMQDEAWNKPETRANPGQAFGEWFKGKAQRSAA